MAEVHFWSQQCVSYKGFDLNFFFTGSQGNDILNYPRFQNEIPGNSGVFGNYYSSVSDFARPSSYDVADALTATLTNPGKKIPRIAPGDPNGNTASVSGLSRMVLISA